MTNRQLSQKQRISRKNACPILKLYDDMILAILHFLDTASVSHFVSSSKRFHSVRNKTILKYFTSSFRNWLSEGDLEFAMCLAIRTGSHELVEFCIERGACNFNRGLREAVLLNEPKAALLFMEKGANLFDYPLAYAIRNTPDMVSVLLKQHVRDWNPALEAAAQTNNLDLVRICLKEGATDLNGAMGGAVEKGHMSMVEFLVSIGACDWRGGLRKAVRNNKQDLIHYFINKGATNWNDAMEAAVSVSPHLVSFFIQKGANDWNSGMLRAASVVDLNQVRFFAYRGANNWNECLCACIKWSMSQKQGHLLVLVNFFVSQGANDFNQGLIGATGRNKPRLVEFFIEKGANDWNGALLTAIRFHYKPWVKYFIKRGATNINEALLELMAAYKIGWWEVTEKIVEFMVKQGVSNWDQAIEVAREKKLPLLVKYFTEKKAWCLGRETSGESEAHKSLHCL